MDARELLDAGPDGYTAARDAEVRRRRSEGDRDGAAALKALGKPSLAMWAVLAAGADAKRARRLVDATSALAGVQASAVRGQGAEQIAEATSARRDAIDAVTDAAIAALTTHIKTKGRVDTYRAEIRGLVDQVSRHPELLDAWLDATLRDIPRDTGFEAFAAIEPSPRAKEDRKPAAAPRRPSPPAAPTRQQLQAEQARARAVAGREAAERDLVAAEHSARQARQALLAAEKANDAAVHALDRARRAHERAVHKVETLEAR